MLFLILPTQLFDVKYLTSDYKYIIWEHPHYFTAYRYNKKKLLLHRASMKYYYNYLQKAGYSVRYVPFDRSPKLATEYIMFDPTDHIKMPAGLVGTIESPNFLLTTVHMQQYREKTTKFFFNAFYMWSKKKLGILPGIKSRDKQNRRKLPSHITVPPLSSITNTDNRYITANKRYVNRHFPNNYGTTDDFQFPVTHKTARQWLKHFIKNKLAKFGDYQDAIVQDEPYLFHSVLSTSLNIGLLNPTEVIMEIMKASNAKTTIPMNSLEGFIRQLFWREYQRYCYTYYNFQRKNYFGNNRRISVTASVTGPWYNGTTGIVPVDDCIKKAFSLGYLHHIERLMIIGNFMNLSGIRPKDGFRWFMEFSCDSYEWVMHQNVLDMVFFVSGGATMRRPYISSSNYILNMSDYKKGPWSETWDELYRAFLKKHRKKLWKYRYYYR